MNHLRRLARDTRRSEHGQTLVLFVGFFSAVLALAAFAVDQGLWFNYRRAAQKDADAAVRVGAAYVAVGLGDNNLSGAESTIAQNITRDNVGNNGAEWADAIISIDADDCPISGGGNIDNAASVEVAVPRPAPGLFTSAFVPNVEDELDEIGARATACTGAIQRLQSDEDNDVEGIPISLVRPSASILADNDYPRNRDCFDTNGALVLGAECVIVWSEEDDEDFGGPRSAFGLDDDDECESSGSTGEIENGIDDGIDTLCSVWTSSCSSDLGDHCVDDFSSNIWDDVLEAFEERFDRSNQCSGSTTRRTSFQATFDFVSGEDLGSAFEAPTSLGGTGGGLPAAEVYVPRDCFSPRTALLPVVMENSNNNGDGRQRVLGFTVVFITGCFDRDSNTSGSTSLGSISGPDDGICNVDFDDDDIEVRGVPLRVMFELESTAGLCPLRVSSTTAPCPASSGSASNIVNAALTIQTTR